MMRNLPELAGVVQRNCDISDARHAGEYGLCTFLLKMREYFRWENELPFGPALPKDELGEWLRAREQHWERIEAQEFAPLPLAGADRDPFDAQAANRELLPQGCVYSAGYGRFRKPLFFLGRLLRVEERAGLTILVSSCEYARELAAPPAMLQGRTIFVRQESARRYVWEKIEEWQWRKQESPMARALACHDFVGDPQAALGRIAEQEMETMILHELGEARAGELLGETWTEMAFAATRTQSEPLVRAVRDLLADCLSTLPALLARADVAALHFYFATFDAPRRQLFPRALEGYEDLARCGSLDALARAVREGGEHWLAEARRMLRLDAAGREAAAEAMLAPAPATPARAC